MNLTMIILSIWNFSLLSIGWIPQYWGVCIQMCLRTHFYSAPVTVTSSGESAPTQESTLEELVKCQHSISEKTLCFSTPIFQFPKLLEF